MTLDLAPLANAPRLLFTVPLAPLQGQRFQPTGFPGLGAATFRSTRGDCLLVESAQSMANRLELTIWDEAGRDLKADLKGLSHVRVVRADKSFLTDTVLESHRLNSPYLLEQSGKQFFNQLKASLGGLETGPVDRKRLATTLLEYDVGSLLHGVFLAKKELAGGRLRVARAMSAFIEADGVRVAASGGVKNDHVNPSGDTKAGFGNVPFARDEFTADSISLYVNIDLAQIRGYGLSDDAVRLLQLLALYKLRTLLDGNLRLRTACDLRANVETVVAAAPSGFELPLQTAIAADIKVLLAKPELASLMKVTEVVFADKIEPKKASAKNAAAATAANENADDNDANGDEA